MTATFTLTGRILDKNEQPVKAAKLVLTATPSNLDDPAIDVVYSPPPKVTTDADGHLIVEGATDPGVELVMGPQYTIRSSMGSAKLEKRRFTAAPPLVEAGGTLDLTDLPLEPVDLPPTFADVIAAYWAPTDNGDGTFTLSGQIAVDNQDGTYTIGAA